MGYVNTQVTLKNIYDLKQAKQGNLPKDKIRQATIDVMGESEITLANRDCRRWHISHLLKKFIRCDSRAKEKCKVTEPLVIKWEDRAVAMSALVIKDVPDFLLGVLPLEGMDLIIDTVNQKLVGAHGKKVVYRV